MALIRLVVPLAILTPLLLAGCIVPGVKIRPRFGEPSPPPEVHTLRTDDAPAFAPSSEERVVVGGSVDDPRYESLGLVVVLLHDDTQFGKDALPEIRKAVAALGADAVLDVRAADEGIYGVAARAKSSESTSEPVPGRRLVMKDSPPARTGFTVVANHPFSGRAVDPSATPPPTVSPGAILLYAGSHAPKAFEPTALVAACRPLPLESAADAMKAQAAALGATAVVNVRIVVHPYLPCDGSFEGGPFGRISGLAVRER
jgi:uncharacterized protein YbjQ (UPF0145 family)